MAGMGVDNVNRLSSARLTKGGRHIAEAQLGAIVRPAGNPLFFFARRDLFRSVAGPRRHQIDTPFGISIACSRGKRW